MFSFRPFPFFAMVAPFLSPGDWGGPPVGLSRPSVSPVPLPRPGGGVFRRAAPHGSRECSPYFGSLVTFSEVPPPNITVVFSQYHVLVGRPADWVNHRSWRCEESGVCVLGLLGFGPHPPSEKVTPFRFAQDLLLFSSGRQVIKCSPQINEVSDLLKITPWIWLLWSRL
jgi:hypothetical protein